MKIRNTRSENIGMVTDIQGDVYIVNREDNGAQANWKAANCVPVDSEQGTVTSEQLSVIRNRFQMPGANHDNKI